MEISLTCAFLILLILFLLYFVLNSFVFRTWNYFNDRGVVFDRGMPGLGSFAAAMLGREAMPNVLVKLYNRYPKHKFIGVYQMGGKPLYFVRDPELIKAITVKDFDSFVNHSFQIDENIDPLFGRNLFNMTDDKWRDMRSVLSPLFTGSKMRVMLSLMNETIEQFISGVREEVARSGADGKEYDLGDLFTCSTNDAIASCAFGFKIDSFRNRSNEFYVMGKAIAYAIQSPKIFLSMCFPKMSKWLRIQVITEKQNDFFRDVVRSSVEYRKKNNIVRNDMIHLMTLMREGKLESIAEAEADQDAGFATITEILTSKTAQKLKNFTDDDLVSQCMIFFLAGFTGVANTLCFLCYELAINPDVQDNLYAEIADAVATLDDQKSIGYEKLQQLKYLDCVVTETLRLWSVNVLVDRLAAKQYVMENSDGSKVVLQPGESVWIPAYAIQRDPKYYPEPDQFRPERFFDDAQPRVDPATYMPFGAGPRACVASRFALMQLKATVFYLMKTFRIECGPNSDVPLKLKAVAGVLEPENGFKLVLKSRDAN